MANLRHFIEFRQNVDVKIESRGTTTGTRIWVGSQMKASVRCYVVSTGDRFIEVADLEIEGGRLRAISCACFLFLDRLD
jgi:hypothetical protein